MTLHVRPVKYRVPIILPLGNVTVQEGPSGSGKTARAEKWRAVDPANRRVVDGDREEAHRLARLGYQVVLNILT